jgi:hypothetical protein
LSHQLLTTSDLSCMRLTSSSSITSIVYNLIGGVMVSVLASSAVDRWCEPWSGQTQDYK